MCVSLWKGLPWWLRWWRIHLQCGRPEFDPWVGKISWRREWQNTSVFLLENSMDRGAWKALVHEVSKSQTRLRNFHFHFRSWKERKERKVAQSCPTLCNPMDCSLPGFSAHGISYARILEWVAIPFSRRSSQPRDLTRVSCIAGRFFTIWATKEAPNLHFTEC